MSTLVRNKIIEELAGSLDIPEKAYDAADKRYKDVAAWFCRQESKCAQYDPHIYPQGSFRLGTVIRPLGSDGEFDLDLGCRLQKGVSKTSHTQKQLKHLVGDEIEAYRVARGIEEKKEEKSRCWRLKYADTLKFHLDAVPSIPESDAQRQIIKAAMLKAGSEDALAAAVVQFSGAITDNQLANYASISPDWRISNSEGYARWFEARMKLARLILEKRAYEFKAAKIDDLPARKWKSPLQRCVQILKRHRDLMFAENGDSKPVSVILTTLAAEAYQGEAELDDAMERILTDMGKMVRRTLPRVPNPVNPAEDFADKWYNPKYQHLNLEQNFWDWLKQAQADFKIISEAREVSLIVEQAHEKFGAVLPETGLGEKLGLGAPFVKSSPKSHIITEPPPKPWATI